MPDIVEILVLGFYPANEMAAFIQVQHFELMSILVQGLRFCNLKI